MYVYEYTFLHHLLLLSLILIIEWNFDQVQTDDDAGSLLSNQMFEDGKTCEFILLSNEMEQQKSQSQKKTSSRFLNKCIVSALFFPFFSFSLHTHTHTAK
jgi:hypothetical protein